MPKPFSGRKAYRGAHGVLQSAPPVVLPEHVVTLTGQQVLSRYDDLIHTAQVAINRLVVAAAYKGKKSDLARMRGYIDGLSRAKRVITDND